MPPEKRSTRRQGSSAWGSQAAPRYSELRLGPWVPSLTCLGPG